MKSDKLPLTIGFLGVGKMATALIRAILEAELVAPEQIICSDISAEALGRAEDGLKIRTTTDRNEPVRAAEVLFLAFKPQNFPEALENLTKDRPDRQIVVSIMAGVAISDIKQYLPGRIVRVMPNTCAMVGQMAAGLAQSDDLNAQETILIGQILATAGTAVQLKEQQLDAVTGLSGSGPAFVAYLIEAFINAGIAEGLPRDVAKSLAIKTFSGTANLLEQWAIEPAELIEMVSSPNGTTVAGRKILESSDLEKVIRQTVRSAAERSRELGQKK